MQIGRIPYANLHAEYLECQMEVDQAIARCIANSSFINGPEVLNFEQQWAAYTRSPACAGVSSGTSALMLALLAVGVQAGDEVIVPTMSFIATAEVVSQIGARPVFIDVDEYYTVDIAQVAAAITGNTRNLVEATCFSFYPGKNLSAIGDAGAVTGSPELVERIKMLRDHGRKEKYVHEMVGWNERLDGLQAAVLAAKLPYLDRWNHRRQCNAEVYLRLLATVPEVELPAHNPASNHVYNQFVIRTDRRDQLRKYLADLNVEAGVQFPLAMHQQPVYATEQSLPRAEDLAARCLSLPVHAQLHPKEIEHVCELIRQFFTLPQDSVEENTFVTIPNQTYFSDTQSRP